jgi:hypothetical protein
VMPRHQFFWSENRARLQLLLISRSYGRNSYESVRTTIRASTPLPTLANSTHLMGTVPVNCVFILTMISGTCGCLVIRRDQQIDLLSTYDELMYELDIMTVEILIHVVETSTKAPSLSSSLTLPSTPLN